MSAKQSFRSLLIALLMPFTAMAAHQGKINNDDTPCLEISCHMQDNGNRFAGYTIIIYCDNAPSDTLTIEKRREVFFTLDYGHQYAIRHIAPGYRDRVVMVNTAVDEKAAKTFSYFDYVIEMVREEEPANTVNDLPVGLVRFDKKLHRFDYSRKYAKEVRRQPDYIAGNN